MMLLEAVWSHPVSVPSGEPRVVQPLRSPRLPGFDAWEDMPKAMTTMVRQQARARASDRPRRKTLKQLRSDERRRRIVEYLRERTDWINSKTILIDLGISKTTGMNDLAAMKGIGMIQARHVTQRGFVGHHVYRVAK